MKNLTPRIECCNDFVETRYSFHASGSWIFKENKYNDYISYLCFPEQMLNRDHETFHIQRSHGKDKAFFNLSIVSARHRKHFKKAIRRWLALDKVRRSESLCSSCVWENNYLLKGKCYEKFNHV